MSSWEGGGRDLNVSQKKRKKEKSWGRREGGFFRREKKGKPLVTSGEVGGLLCGRKERPLSLRQRVRKAMETSPEEKVELSRWGKSHSGVGSPARGEKGGIILLERIAGEKGGKTLPSFREKGGGGTWLWRGLGKRKDFSDWGAGRDLGASLPSAGGWEVGGERGGGALFSVGLDPEPA